MKWRHLILPFVVVLIAVAVALAAVIDAEPETPTFVYHAEDVLVADVSGEEIAPAFAGEIDLELERFAEPQIVGSADTRNRSDNYLNSAHEAQIRRCICPLCASKSAIAGNSFYSAYTAAMKGAQRLGVRAGLTPKGVSVTEHNYVVQCAAVSSPSAAGPQELDVRG